MHHNAYRGLPKPQRVTFGHRPKIDGHSMSARFAVLPAWAPLEEGHRPRRILIAEVQAVVARLCGLTMAEMLSCRRTWNISRPRQIAIYLCHKHTSSTVSEIARRFGGRDHTTALHAIKVIGQRRSEDAEVEAVIGMAEAELRA